MECRHTFGRSGTWFDVSENANFYHKRCKVCGKEEMLKKRKGTIDLFGNPVAFYKDQTGRMIPVDSKGRVTDKDPYYKKGDPRGWKRAGHKDTRGYERSIHLEKDGRELK